MTENVKSILSALNNHRTISPDKLYLFILALHWAKALKESSSLKAQCKRLDCSAIQAISVNSLPTLSVSELVELFELVYCEESDREKEGKFYTPLFIIEQACLSTGVSTNTQVLDPSCGAGAFLVYLCEKLIRTYPKPFHEQIALINKCIFGIDRDHFAVTVCKELLKLLAFKHSTDQPETIDCEISSIVHADTLDSIKSKEDLSEVFSVKTMNGFDLIIGNPPYGLARDDKLTKSENDKLKSDFKAYRFGKVNKYLVFMALCSELLNKDGILRFVVPNAWLGLKTAKNLRKFWYERCALQKVEILPSDTFSSAKVEPILFTYQNSSNKSEYIQISSCKDKRVLRYSYNTWSRAPDYCIPTIWSSFAETFFDQCEKTCFTLGNPESPFVPFIALQAYATGKGTPAQTKEDVTHHVFHSFNRRDNDYLPYSDGKDIYRFGHNWSGKYLHYGPWLAEHQPIERYTQPRLVVREILGKAPRLLSATYLDEPLVYNRSVLHILPNSKSSKLLILSLLGILNSAVGSFIIKVRGKKSQRKLFPKLVNDDLKQFPIPQRIFDCQEVLGSLVLKRLESTDERLDEEIDLEVIKLYEFSNSDLQEINQTLKL